MPEGRGKAPDVIIIDEVVNWTAYWRERALKAEQDASELRRTYVESDFLNQIIKIAFTAGQETQKILHESTWDALEEVVYRVTERM